MPEYIWCTLGNHHRFCKGKSCLRNLWQAFEAADNHESKGDTVNKGFFFAKIFFFNDFFARFHWTPDKLMGEEVTTVTCTENPWPENGWKMFLVLGMFVSFL